MLMLSPLRTRPMEAKTAETLPLTGRWQFEPKWDGFRCLAFRNGAKVDLRAKSGKPLGRYFPEILAALRGVGPKRFVLDGELTIPVGESLSFGALQMRLHPAQSRIDRLAAETPALFILFDMLEGRECLVEKPLHRRRAALEDFHAGLKNVAELRLSPFSRHRAEALLWLRRAGGDLDGVVAKELDGAYHCGERSMVKVKCLRTADCVVGGFRYATGSRKVGSLLLGLFNQDGKLDHVGFTSGIVEAERAALARKLEQLRGGEGFTGNAPGGPSRWSTERSAQWIPLRHELVAEVQYDHISDQRFRHGTRFLRWRPDKAPRQCRMDQLRREARPAKLLREIFR